MDAGAGVSRYESNFTDRVHSDCTLDKLYNDFNQQAYIARDIFVTLKLMLTQSQVDGSSANFPAANIAAALNYIHNYACEGLSLRRLVQETQRVPAAVFVKQFKKATGQTPNQAIRRRQLESARRLLDRTELSLGFITEHCGFQSVNALGRAFKAAEGALPAAFRKAQRAEKSRRPAPTRAKTSVTSS
jgi:transcriptional regulator GlxA family with amidase domain